MYSLKYFVLATSVNAVAAFDIPEICNEVSTIGNCTDALFENNRTNATECEGLHKCVCNEMIERVENLRKAGNAPDSEAVQKTFYYISSYCRPELEGLVATKRAAKEAAEKAEAAAKEAAEEAEAAAKEAKKAAEEAKEAAKDGAKEAAKDGAKEAVKKAVKEAAKENESALKIVTKQIEETAAKQKEAAEAETTRYQLLMKMLSDLKANMNSGFERYMDAVRGKNVSRLGQAAAIGGTLAGIAGLGLAGKMAYNRMRRPAVQPTPTPIAEDIQEESSTGGKTSPWLWVSLIVIVFVGAGLVIYFRGRM